MTKDQDARQHLIADLDEYFSPAGIQRRRRNFVRRTISWVLIVRFLSLVRRLADIAVACCLLIVFCPLFLTLGVISKMSGGSIRRTLRIGRWAVPFIQFSFDFGRMSQKPLLRWRASIALPTLWNILRGDMSFVGPRAASPAEILPSERAAWKRYDVRPGLVCLWWLRNRANMAYQSEAELDAEYTETNSLMGDLGIVVRSLPALAYGNGAELAPPQVELLQIRIDNLTMVEAIESILSLASLPAFHQISFVNTDCVNIATRDSAYREILRTSKIVLGDGIGVRLAGRLLNQNIRENVNGTDLFPQLCEAIQKAGLGLYLLGGRPGVPDGVAAWITQRYPNLKLQGWRNGYFSQQEEQEVIRQIRQSGADILLVAFGVPKQEKWISQHKEDLGVHAAMGVGGLFDFYSGRIPRAPVWMRELGLEWIYRFLQEPRRMWRRYFVGNGVFLYRVLRERWLSNQSAERTANL